MLRALPILLLLAGCVAQPFEEGGLQDLFRGDVERALELAEQSNDELAIRCYTYLLTIAPDRSLIPSPGEQEIAGAVTVYQRARNARRSVTGDVSNEFRIACSPLLADSRAVIRRLGIRILSPL